MSATYANAADWPITYGQDVTGYDPVILEAAEAAARSSLWGLLGRQFGKLTTVDELHRVYPWVELDHSERLLPSSRIETVGPFINLRYGPLRRVVSLSIDGHGPAAEWRAEMGGVRLLFQPLSERLVTITYRWGANLPGGASAALGELAYEFVRGMTDQTCKLSSRAVSIARQGVTIDMLDAQELLDSGVTGLPLTDSLIRSVNPMRRQFRSRVLSPDSGRLS
jgi:hypothetical protein